MNQNSFDAVIFDLDGVITQTALVHSTAWKKMFDEFLKEYYSEKKEDFKEFEHTRDYLPYVDGKPRYKGVQSFLESRNINLEFGSSADSSEMKTICGLGNRKDKAFNEILKTDGVKVYESTVSFIKELKARGIRIGVASSSKNCKSVLEAANLLHYFETRVDGLVSAELGLNGKPEPDIFITAADNLGVDYHKTIIVEDAVSGVQAGAKGNFGLVLGIAREDNERELEENGADLVINDLSELSVDHANIVFAAGIKNDGWLLCYKNYDIKKERTREALLTVGNGYFGTRGAFEEPTANNINYQGTYIAGIYNRLITPIAGKNVENEDFVNCPTWLPITFKIDNGEWFDANKSKILKIKRILNFRTGILSKEIFIEIENGKQLKIKSLRLAGMHQPHIAAMKYEIMPLNFSGNIEIKSSLNGNLRNEGVERYKQLNSQHLESSQEGVDDDTIFIEVKTIQSKIKIAQAARHILKIEGKTVDYKPQYKACESIATCTYNLPCEQNKKIEIEKLVAIYTSNDKDVENPLTSAIFSAKAQTSFEAIKNESAKSWEQIWNEIDIEIEGDRFSQKLLRLHLYHTIVSGSPHNQDIDASFTARGLHGEAYRGHIFWDELFILPFYNIHFPETTKASLLYRYNRLDAARKYAQEYGYTGAMYPWQSGSDGREETQIIHINPLDGSWGDDYSSLQRHVSLAIAYNIWQYVHITNDFEFLTKYGAEMFFEICRFWAHRSAFNRNTGRYEIKNVMGPDEFHEKLENSEEGGLKDNAYTNIMTVWMLGKANIILNKISENELNTLKNKINLSDEEILKWNDIISKMNLEISEEGILAQFDGYFDLKELDWYMYREKYKNIYRMDRILKREGKSADEYKVAKQADTLITFFNLEEEEVTKILENLGYQLPADYLKRNLNYYLKRTSHGSTLSRVVHTQLANMVGDYQLGWTLYSDALSSDFDDIQGGTTAEGIHLGVMTSTVLMAITTYAGINFKGEYLKITPQLPKQWKTMKFTMNFKGINYIFKISNECISVVSNKIAKVEILDKAVELQANKEFAYCM